VRAVLVEEFGVVPRVTDVPDPRCPPDGAVVRVDATGLCRSDWHAFAGHDPDVALPHVPGHEFAGVVEEVGADVRGWVPGERVTAPFVNACGTCPTCRRGDHQVCERQTQPGFDRWGSFAERVVVRPAEVNLVRLPDGVDAVAAAALGCRFATAYRAVVEVGRVRPGEWVAVHGCGGVGLSAVMVAVAAGARVVAVDVRPEVLALAARFGAEASVEVPAGGPPDPLAVADEVRRAAGGAPVDLSLDALGSPATCAASIAGLRPRGRHVQVGLLPAVLGWPQVPLHLAIARELELLGSHGMAAHSYPGMLGLVERGRLRPTELVAGTIGLDAVPAALAALGTAPPAGMTVALPGAGRPGRPG
jgi:alcohol dehydrogenase